MINAIAYITPYFHGHRCDNAIRSSAVEGYRKPYRTIFANCCRTDCGLCGVIFVYLALIMAFYGNSIAAPLPRHARVVEVLVRRLSLCNRSHSVYTIRGVAGIVRTGNLIDPSDRPIDRSVGCRHCRLYVPRVSL